MSAGLLGLDGLVAPRLDSQVVDSNYDLTTGWNDWLGNWNQNYATRSTPIAPTYVPGRQEAIQGFVNRFDPGMGVEQLASRAFGNNAGPDGLQGYVDAASRLLGGADAFNKIDNMAHGYWTSGYTPDPNELARLQAEKATKETARNGILASQQAYTQQTGGGFTGGLLNDSYANPFGSTITGGAGTGASNLGMGTGLGATAGASNGNAAPSTGLNPWLPQGLGAAAPSTGAAPWGGPFGNSNPWSLAG